MNALLKFLGALFLAVLLLLGGLAALYVPKGFAMQKSAVSYMKTHLPLIVADWNADEVVKRGAPEFLVPAVREGLPTVFQQLSQLGKFKSMGKPQGTVVVANLQLAFHRNSVSAETGGTLPKPVWAELVADAEFDAAPAKVKLTLVRRGDDWRIVGFWIGPSSAAP
jgi:hypothetical protein